MLLEQVDQGVRNGFWCCWSRCFDTNPVAMQFAGFRVDDGSLDSRSADVNADDVHIFAPCTDRGRGCIRPLSQGLSSSISSFCALRGLPRVLRCG